MSLTCAICYLDEVVEARHDSLAILHSLTDHRRALYLDRADEVVHAPETFMLACSYNPAYRSSLKELKPSFRQRFMTLTIPSPSHRARRPRRTRIRSRARPSVDRPRRPVNGRRRTNGVFSRNRDGTGSVSASWSGSTRTASPGRPRRRHRPADAETDFRCVPAARPCRRTSGGGRGVRLVATKGACQRVGASV
ncbi:hypothetical protein GCM10011588_22150 [Nocardia jinanensis]|uniref:ATPase dynein-related AAA domain-containing protein n=1 Tax=Nocardia jinanensis TaxID=382504 RepID=A0A917RHM8_9NOCA|nr:hypothetical protein GCM10011588_22150 [Nocardia jinanensis]